MGALPPDVEVGAQAHIPVHQEHSVSCRTRCTHWNIADAPIYLQAAAAASYTVAAGSAIVLLIFFLNL